MMVNYKVSPSTLSLLEECPHCFWLHIVKKIQRPNGAFPSLPSGMDLVLKAHFDTCRQDNEIPLELKKHKIDAKLFHDTGLLKTWRSNFHGIEYKDEESGVILKGCVDDILEKDGKLIVLDFKTRGFPAKDNTKHFYQDQINLYNFLLRKNGFETEDYGYLLFFHPIGIDRNGNFIFESELAKMEVNIGHAEKLFRKAIKVLEEGMPECSDKCGFCRWLESAK